MRIANGVISVLFLYFMVVQYNDPDPLFWIICYGVTVVFTLLAMAGIYIWFTGAVALGYLLGAVYLVPGWGTDTVMLLLEPKMYRPEVELAREAFGLFICAVWMVVLTYVWLRRHAADEADTETDAGSTSA